MKTQLGILTSIALVLAGCSKQAAESKAVAAAAAAKAAEPAAIRMAAAEVRKVEKTISVTGSLLPDETVNVSAEVPGRVVAIHADFGQPVKKGEVLAELDTQELALAARPRRRRWRRRWRASVSARAGGRDSRNDARHAAGAGAAGRRALQVRERGQAGQDRRHRAGALHRTGEGLQARQAALEATRDELRTQLASIQALRADVRLAEKRLNDATVRAPFDGAVTARLISPGQYTQGEHADSDRGEDQPAAPARGDSRNPRHAACGWAPRSASPPTPRRA